MIFRSANKYLKDSYFDMRKITYLGVKIMKGVKTIKIKWLFMRIEINKSHLGRHTNIQSPDFYANIHNGFDCFLGPVNSQAIIQLGWHVIMQAGK